MNILLKGLDKRGTIDNPLPSHYLLAEMVIEEQVSLYREIELKQVTKNPGRNRVRVIWKGREYLIEGIKQTKEGRWYLTDKETDIPTNATLDRVFQRILRNPIKDFKNPPEILQQKHRECAGGGWYSMIPIYKYKGKHYCDFECSQTMNSLYWADATSRIPKDLR